MCGKIVKKIPIAIKKIFVESHVIREVNVLSQGGNKRSDWNRRSTLTQVSSCALYFFVQVSFSSVFGTAGAVVVITV